MLSFSSAIGNLFNRLGKLGLLIKQAGSYQAAQLTNFTDATNGVTAQYDAEPDVQALVGSAYISALNNTASIGTLAQSVAAATINRMVFRDNPRQGQTLTQQNTLASILEVIRQMKIAGATVRACTVTATPGTFTGTGNGAVVASVKRALDGVTMENAFAESLLLTCQADSYSGGTSAGNESIQVVSPGGQGNLFAFNWPLGSNARTAFSVIDGNSDNSAGNVLTNSGFEDWTSNTPDNFTLVTGTAGTHVIREATIVYDGTYSMMLVGDGATQVTLTQTFNSSSGTSFVPDQLTQFAVNVWLRRDGTAAASGVLTIDLIDQNDTVVNDEAGTPNSFTIDLTSLTVEFAPFNGTFRLPAILPTTLKLRIRQSTPLENGRTVYVDKLGMGLMTQIYTGGPSLAVFAGSNPFEIGDYATVAVTNSRGSGGVLDTFQTLLYRLFPDVVSNEILFPSSASPSISDTLIG